MPTASSKRSSPHLQRQLGGSGAAVEDLDAVVCEANRKGVACRGVCQGLDGLLLQLAFKGQSDDRIQMHLIKHLNVLYEGSLGCQGWSYSTYSIIDDTACLSMHSGHTAAEHMSS